MKDKTLKVVIPMAGLGTRLRPHTWSKPKQLVSVAGKTVLNHLIDSLATYPDFKEIELINIVGYLSDQIEDCIETSYPDLRSRFVLQDNPRGQSHAIHLAKEFISGPTLVVFADTLIETDLSFLDNEKSGAIVWVKEVPDPRRFGVVRLNDNGLVTRLIEKPDSIEDNLVVVGFYFFREGGELIAAIEEQMKRDIQLKGEFFLADAINIMLERGLEMRPETVDVWLDAGTPQTLLETNRYLLENGCDNTTEASRRAEFQVVPPVFVHPSARIQNAVVGPFVSIGAECQIQDCVIKNSIFEEQSRADGVILEGSLIGRNAQLEGRWKVINAGDDTVLTV
jgi:glucose-1-phosphate thymidylyltransferase